MTGTNVLTINKNSELGRGITIRIGLIILGFFLLFRPITVSFHHIGSISILDVFGVTISYLIFFGVLLNINRIRLDLTSLLIIFFSFYCVISLVWGSGYRDIVRMILPFLPFFLTKVVVQDKKSSTVMLEVIAWGYLVPVLGSIALIMLGLSDVTISGSMVERQSGLSSGVHTQGHLMLFFSFSFALYCLVEKEKQHFKWIMFLLFIGTLFCIFKTYTRTVILGGGIFWFSHLFCWKRKLFFLLLIFSVVIIFLKFDDIKKVVTQEDAISQSSRGVDINAASSGRFWIWEHNLELFTDLPLTTKLMGVGLGNELKSVPGKAHKRWVGSHNDYLSLLITTGVIGVLLYLMIYGSVFFSLLLAPMDWKLRLFGMSVLIAVMSMNFVSNSYIVRFQMAQLFWFLVGLLYVQRTIKNKQSRAESLRANAGSLYPKRV